MKCNRALIAVGVFLALALTVHAQTTTGTIYGTVADETGAVVPVRWNGDFE